MILMLAAAMLVMNDTSGNDISARMPTPIPMRMPVPAVDAPPAPPANPCEAAERQDSTSPEMIARTSAKNSNRLNEFRAFLKRYPKSACAAPAKEIVTERDQEEARFKAAQTTPATEATPAIISGDPAFGITSDDYPVAAMRNREEGVVAIAYEIAPDGRIEGCHVTGSSGSAALDQATCRICSERARYVPARNARGRPMRSYGTRRIRWQVPKNEPLEPQ